jgi:hypothetical protein
VWVKQKTLGDSSLLTEQLGAIFCQHCFFLVALQACPLQLNKQVKGLQLLAFKNIIDKMQGPSERFFSA